MVGRVFYIIGILTVAFGIYMGVNRMTYSEAVRLTIKLLNAGIVNEEAEVKKGGD